MEVTLKEYQRETKAWNEMPFTMIQKVAESQALRKAFSASGLYAPEEFGEEEKPAMKVVTPEKEKKGLMEATVGAAINHVIQEGIIKPSEGIIDADAKQAQSELTEAEKERAAVLDAEIKKQGKRGKK